MASPDFDRSFDPAYGEAVSVDKIINEAGKTGTERINEIN